MSLKNILREVKKITTHYFNHNVGKSFPKDVYDKYQAERKTMSIIKKYNIKKGLKK